MSLSDKPNEIFACDLEASASNSPATDSTSYQFTASKSSFPFKIQTSISNHHPSNLQHLETQEEYFPNIILKKEDFSQSKYFVKDPSFLVELGKRGEQNSFSRATEQKLHTLNPLKHITTCIQNFSSKCNQKNILSSSSDDICSFEKQVQQKHKELIKQHDENENEQVRSNGFQEAYEHQFCSEETDPDQIITRTSFFSEIENKCIKNRNKSVREQNTMHTNSERQKENGTSISGTAATRSYNSEPLTSTFQSCSKLSKHKIPSINLANQVDKVSSVSEALLHSSPYPFENNTTANDECSSIGSSSTKDSSSQSLSNTSSSLSLELLMKEGILETQQQRKLCLDLEWNHNGERRSMLGETELIGLLKRWKKADLELADVQKSSAFVCEGENTSSWNGLAKQKKELIKSQIKEAKQHWKLFRVWPRKDWIESEEEKQMWADAEMVEELKRERNEADAEATFEELQNRLKGEETSELNEYEKARLAKVLKKKLKQREKEERRRQESDMDRFYRIVLKKSRQEALRCPSCDEINEEIKTRKNNTLSHSEIGGDTRQSGTIRSEGILSQSSETLYDPLDKLKSLLSEQYLQEHSNNGKQISLQNSLSEKTHNETTSTLSLLKGILPQKEENGKPLSIKEAFQTKSHDDEPNEQHLPESLNSLQVQPISKNIFTSCSLNTKSILNPEIPFQLSKSSIQNVHLANQFLNKDKHLSSQNSTGIIGTSDGFASKFNNPTSLSITISNPFTVISNTGDETHPYFVIDSEKRKKYAKWNVALTVKDEREMLPRFIFSLHLQKLEKKLFKRGIDPKIIQKEEKELIVSMRNNPPMVVPIKCLSSVALDPSFTDLNFKSFSDVIRLLT